jgi:hypothetical protein
MTLFFQVVSTLMHEITFLIVIISYNRLSGNSILSITWCKQKMGTASLEKSGCFRVVFLFFSEKRLKKQTISNT